MATRQAANEGGWILRRAAGGRAAAGRRGAAGAPPAMPPEFLQAPGVRVEEVLDAVPAPAAAARRAAPPDLVLDVDVAAGEAALLAVRHPSGALTFHPSDGAGPVGRRGAGRARPPHTARFQVPIRRDGGAAVGRRGLPGLPKAVQVVVVKVGKQTVDKVVSLAVPKLVAQWEQRSWSRRGLSEGWFHVTATGGQAPGIRLAAATPPRGERSLVLVHGTFSNAAGAFGMLAGTDFFGRVAPLYGERIYAFNHFSLGRTPEENAAMLLEALPAGEYSFDAVAHSRGGLVLRNLVEHSGADGDRAARVTLGHAVLVATPNDGTPLAVPARWRETVGWLANLLEMFPANPFTTGAEFVSEAVVWLASHLLGDVPGLRSMDSAGPLVAELQSPPGPPPGAYSALVSNFHPDAALWQRALDVGVDTFFSSANDLVVPSEGGWRTDRDGAAHVPASRIGCFGPGGNLRTTDGGSVTHVNFFERAETAAFLARALAGQPQGLPAIDPGAPLPDRRFTRSAAVGATVGGTVTGGTVTGGTVSGAVPGTALPPPADAIAAAALAAPSAAPPSTRPPSPSSPADDIDAFHIVIMDVIDPDAKGREGKRRLSKYARVLATYGGARVTTTMRLRAEGSEPKTLFSGIIDFHERIEAYTNREQGSLPTDDEMMTFGGQLFDTLFQGDVRRLYDEARSRQRGHKLDLVMTSMIPWIAEKPWEFAYDTGRKSFLATEEIHFVRNVLTNVPADPIVTCHGPMRMLVASAQPVGFGQLSIDQEVEVIRRGFEPLIEAGMLTVEVLPRATPAALHGHLSTGNYSIVHFIGHGVFDAEKGEGCLLFEDTRGGSFALGERSVREIFCQRGLSLVFLNACQSGTGSRADFNKGVAQSLVAHGLPALVANQYSVLDSSATSFAQHFYWSLAQGMTLGQAAREARVAVNYSMQGELIDWAVPVLYARDANRALCSRPAVVTSQVPVTTVRAASRRAITDRAVRVAVWDIDDVFPSLDQTLDRMNDAQQTYGFELVDMSVPLDVWDLESEPGTFYLWAEKLAKRLQSKTVELRVDLLACVTRHPMRDDDWLNLYGWWPNGRKPPVAIFSAAGIAMKAEGPDTDRAIANAMASALAGFFGDLDVHERGAKDCPLSFNEARDLRYIVGALKFDPACRRKLSGSIKAQLPALDALLKAFR